MHIHGSPRKSVATRHQCTEQALGHLREGCFCFDGLPVRRRHTGWYRRQTVQFVFLTRSLDEPSSTQYTGIEKKGGTCGPAFPQILLKRVTTYYPTSESATARRDWEQCIDQARALLDEAACVRRRCTRDGDDVVLE